MGKSVLISCYAYTMQINILTHYLSTSCEVKQMKWNKAFLDIILRLGV